MDLTVPSASTGLPAQGLIYITVADIDASLACCTERGGKILAGLREIGGGSRFSVLQDPARAVAALDQAG